MTNRVHCAHGYVLMQDSCPGCDAAAETAHTADPVRVKASWEKQQQTRCRNCGERPSHRIHQKATR